MQEWTFQNLSVDKVHKLFKEWGGIPRYVLVGVLDMDIQHQLKDAIGLCDEKIFRYIGGSDSKDDVSRKLVHIWTNLPAERWCWKWRGRRWWRNWRWRKNRILILLLVKIILEQQVDIIMNRHLVTCQLYTQKIASDYVVEEVTRNVKRIITINCLWI